MADHDDTEALRAENAELRAEVEHLRAWRNTHVCAPGSGCTCPHPTAAAPVAPLPCPVHSGRVTIGDPSGGWFPNVCGGAAGVAPTVVWNPGDPPLNVWQPTGGAAGGYAAQVFTFAAP